MEYFFEKAEEFISDYQNSDINEHFKLEKAEEYAIKMFAAYLDDLAATHNPSFKPTNGASLPS